MVKFVPPCGAVQLSYLRLFVVCRTDGSLPDLEAESLNLAPGVIWNALNIDYPGHSFSHLGVFYGKYCRRH